MEVLIAVLVPLGVLLLGLFVGSVLLRAAVSLAKRTIGPVRSDRFIGWDWDEDEPDPPDDSPPIREPATVEGMFICGLLGLMHGVMSSILLTALEADRWLTPADELRLLFITLPIHGVVGLLVLSLLLGRRLRTKFRWAALAAFFFYLIVVALTLMVSALVSVLLAI